MISSASWVVSIITINITRMLSGDIVVINIITNIITNIISIIINSQ